MKRAERKLRKSDCKWWGYVKACIADYPRTLREAETPPESWTGQRRREYDGVRMAIEETEKLPDGERRVSIIRLSLWGNQYTLQGAAVQNYVSVKTAQRWRNAFIILTARHMGLLD